MEVQLLDPGPDVPDGGAAVSGGAASLWRRCRCSTHSFLRQEDGAQRGDACELCQGSLPREVKLYPEGNLTEGLPLRGHGDLVLWCPDLDSRDPAGQGEDEGGLAADHRVGTHTLQGIGVNKLRARVLGNRGG